MKILLTGFYVVIISCSIRSQDAATLIKLIDQELINNRTTISKVLADEKYMALHSLTEFRELIKRNATPEKVIMVTAAEPGTRVIINGTVKTKHGAPVADALVYVYQTSGKGWYSDTAAHILQNEGDMNHARLFAYIKTNSNGVFEFETIKPKGYPRSDLPAHIHIAMWKNNNYIPGVPGELLFNDDERLTPQRKAQALSNGFLIEKNSSSSSMPVYKYNITVGE